MKAIVKSSGREVNIEIIGDMFYVISGRFIHGPFSVNDKRFIIGDK